MGFNIHILSGRRPSQNLDPRAAVAALFNPHLDSSQKQPALEPGGWWPAARLAGAKRKRAPAPAAGSRARSAVLRRCATPHQKRHGTEAGDEVEVVYPWHPWVGRTVCVHEVVERGAIASARCSLAGAAPVRIRELPLWMLDAAGCRTMRVEAHPMATLCALAALHALVSAERKRSEAELEAAAIASPESRGDRHGTSSSDLPHPVNSNSGWQIFP
jgi:hypothetical protein